MNCAAEKVFPRGGKNPALSKSFKAPSFSLFNKNKKAKETVKPKKSHKKQEAKENGCDERDCQPSKENAFTVKHVDDLTPGILHEGMLVLGVVSQVTDRFVNMSLPGGIKGVISIQNISQFYKGLILNATGKSEVPNLGELFKVGDVLPGKVISVTDDDRYTFYLTLDPKLVNSKVGDLETGLILSASVKSEEDHGYILDFGVSSVSGFLNFDKIPNGEKLKKGKIIRCVIVNCINSPGSWKLEVSILPRDLKEGVVSSDSSYPIHAFIPGFQFHVVTERILKNGLLVSLKKDESYKGFVSEDYLPKLFPRLDRIKVGQSFTATLLYIKPLVNVPYFRITSDDPDNWIYKYGQVVQGRVAKSSRAGVVFRIGPKSIPMKCFVPFIKLADREKLIENDSSIDKMYPFNKTVDAIRLGSIDYMKKCYMGATDRSSLKEKYFAVSNLTCGEIVPCKITELRETYVRVLIGKTIIGVIGNTDLTDIPMKKPGGAFKVGQKVKARVLEIDNATRFVRLTMKPSLLKKKLKLLTNCNESILNDGYVGTVFKVFDGKVVVKFFNGIMGHVPKSLTPHNGSVSLRDHFEKGQLVKCYVIRILGHNDLKLSLIPRKVMNCSFKIGGKYEASVVDKNDLGLVLDVHLPEIRDVVRGVLPNALICDYPGLGPALSETYSVNDKLQVYHVLYIEGQLPIFGMSPTICNLYETLGKGTVNDDDLFCPGVVYPFLYRFVSSKTGEMILAPLLPGQAGNKFYVKKENVSDNSDANASALGLQKYQLVSGAVLHRSGKSVYVSLKLSDVWDKNFRNALSLLDHYLDGMKRLIDFHRSANEKYVEGVHLGCQVHAPSEGSSSQTPVARVKKAHFDRSNVNGEAVKGRVVWIKGDEKVLCVNTNPGCVSDIDLQQDGEFDSVDAVHRARIVYTDKDVVVAALKGKGKGRLVFLPRKRHINDFFHSICPYQIGCLTRVWVQRGNLKNLVAIDREVLLLEEKNIWNSHEAQLRSSAPGSKRRSIPVEWQSKIRKMDNGRGDADMEVVHVNLAGTPGDVKEEEVTPDDDIQCEYDGVGGRIANGDVFCGEIKQEAEDSEEGEANGEPSAALDGIHSMDVEVKSEDESDGGDAGKGADVFAKERILLSSSSDSDSDDDDVRVEKDPKNNLSVGFNWDVLKNRGLLSGANAKGEDESSDDNEEEENTKKKRVKLSKKEREAQAKLEEERLRKVEERLMRTDLEPETADDFDRALLGKPNSSALWVKYMAFHLQATEIEKARTVARRALKTIAFNEEQEKLNVWVSLLNLENLYGNEESLNKTVGEALMCNEPYHIHVHMLNLNGQSNRFMEMERIGNMLMKKFKDIERVWQDVGLAYYKVEKLESARNVLQRALPLLEKKAHVELISKFAQFENKYGSSERAQTLYETILSSFPKRVDIWSCYVDMLVKSKMVDLARQVLERATSQHLPPKKMKILFKKFVDFEERHGDAKNVEKVRESAAEYIENVGKMGK